MEGWTPILYWVRILLSIYHYYSLFVNSICVILKSEDLYLLYLFQPGFDQILINHQLDRGLPIGIELILNGYLSVQ